METVLKMKEDPRVERMFPIYMTGSLPIAILRNRAVAIAAGAKCDYLLMIDNDMLPDRPAGSRPFWDTAWGFMMARDRGLPPATVAAPYLCDADEGFYSTDWRTDDRTAKGDDDVVLIRKEDAFARRGIGPVASTQTGLILYDMRAFDVIEPPWFTFDWQEPSHMFMSASEDHYQTRKSGASGCPVYVAWDSWACHLKTQYVTRGVPEGVDCEA